MKTLRFLPFALLALFTSSLIAQIDGSPRQFESTSQVYDELFKMINTREKPTYEIDWDNVKGSPYLNEDYKLAQFFVGKKAYGNIMMRYNTYTDEIELMPAEGKGEDDIEALMKVDDSRVTFGNKTLKLFSFEDEDGTMQKGYFLILNTAKNVKLLLRKKCVFSPNEKALTANQADRAAKFTQYDYFYILKDGMPVQVSPKKKEIVKIFPTKKNKIKDYIKTKKLKLKKQQDFAKLVDYIATL